jgi:hypothetical protein
MDIIRIIVPSKCNIVNIKKEVIIKLWMSNGIESAPNAEPSPESTPQERLVSYLHSIMRKAFDADLHADEYGEGDNGTFTKRVVLHDGNQLLENTWRVILAPPFPRSRHYYTEVYLPLDPRIHVQDGEPFEIAGKLFIREVKGNLPGPLELVDERGVSPVEAISLDPADIFTRKPNLMANRASELLDELGRCNMVASDE